MTLITFLQLSLILHTAIELILSYSSTTVAISKLLPAPNTDGLALVASVISNTTRRSHIFGAENISSIFIICVAVFLLIR